MKERKIRDIRCLLTVLVGAMAVAVACVGVLLWRYNPSGDYLAKAVLIDPALFPQLQEKVRDPETGRWIYYTFGVVLWEKEGVRRPFSLDEYRQFFTEVAEKKSTTTYTGKGFDPKAGKMTLWLHASSTAPDRLLQEVEFSQNGDFRVRLPDGDWVYFTSD